MISKKSLKILLSLVCILLVIFCWNSYQIQPLINGSLFKETIVNRNCENYRQYCFSLYKKLRFPDKKLMFSPALKEIPKELFDAFTVNGDMKLTKNFYFNDVPIDAYSDDKKVKYPVNIKEFEDDRERAKKWLPNKSYGDTEFHKKLDQYKEKIKSRSIVNNSFLILFFVFA